MDDYQKRKLKILREEFILEIGFLIRGEKSPVNVWNSLTNEPIITKGEKILKKMIVRMVDAHANLDMDVDHFRLVIMPKIADYSDKVKAITT